MVDVWWTLLGAAIPAVIAGQAVRVKRRRADVQRLNSARGREKNSDEVFVCERVCTSKRMLKRVGAFSKDPTPDTCVTVCGVSELDACTDACARTVCVNQHQVPNWNDICLRRCQSECLKLSSSYAHWLVVHGAQGKVGKHHYRGVGAMVITLQICTIVYAMSTCIRARVRKTSKTQGQFFIRLPPNSMKLHFFIFLISILLVLEPYSIGTMSIACLTCQPSPGRDVDTNGRSTGSGCLGIRLNRSLSDDLKPPSHPNAERNRSSKAKQLRKMHTSSGPLADANARAARAAVVAEMEDEPRLVRSGGLRREWSFEDLRNRADVAGYH